MAIFGQLVGDEQFHDLDKRIDSIIKNINIPSNEDKTEYPMSDILNTFVGDSVDDESQISSNDEINKLFQSASVPRERLARYQLYSEIKRSVPIIGKIIQKYTSNILSKNPINNQMLIVQPIDDSADDSKTNNSKQFVEHVINHFSLPNKLKNVLTPNILTYGDYFVEIVDVDERVKNIDFNKINANSISSISMINESNQIINKLDIMNNNKFDDATFESALKSIVDLFITVDVDSLTELHSNKPLNEDQITDSNDNSQTKNDTNDTDDLEEYPNDLSDILLKYHKPHNILVLETDFKTRIGYLEIQKQGDTWGHMTTQSITQAVSKLSSISNKNKVSPSALTNQLLSFILKKVFIKVKEKQPNIQDFNNIDFNQFIKNIIGDEQYDVLRRMFVEQGFDSKSTKLNPLKVRFIPTYKMVQFNCPSGDYEPYGQSIIENLILPGKLYMLTQLSNVVHKLSRASLVRTWTIDMGTSRMGSQAINKLKRELYNTRLTLNDLTNFKSIPKIMSDFKDMFILTKQGQTPLDVKVDSYGDPNINVEDLRDQRNEIIAISGVPGVYLGYHDAVELRESLSTANISFATDIIDIQESFNNSLTELINNISKLKGFNKYNPSEHVKIFLIPPVVLILQLIESTLSSIGNIAGIFQNMNVKMDPYFFLQQYIPQIDWDKFKDFAQKYSSKQHIKTELSGNDEQQGNNW